MKFIPRDTLWCRSPSAAAAYRPWLRDRGSLTRRIQSRCPALSVKVVFQGMRRANRDERFVFSRHTRVLVREVYLYCRHTPVVFAHSVIDARDLRGAWRRLARMGSQPLGAALFADPRIKRHALRYRRLNPRHELYRRACELLERPPACLWARRSGFVRRGARLLVTEVFLPAVLELAP